MSGKKARSTQAVVGLWGNEHTITRGLGHECSKTWRIRSRNCTSSFTSPVIGISRTAAPANSGPQMWIGYDGDGTMATSPASSSTHMTWLKPSLAPIVEIHTLSGRPEEHTSELQLRLRKPSTAFSLNKT